MLLTQILNNGSFHGSQAVLQITPAITKKLTPQLISNKTAGIAKQEVQFSVTPDCQVILEQV